MNALGRVSVGLFVGLTMVSCSGGGSAPANSPTPASQTVVATEVPMSTMTPLPTATPIPGPFTPTPLPKGLATVESPRSGPVTVWVYAGSPGASNCDDLLGSMIPAELFETAVPREKATCQRGNARYVFVQDSSGTFYLDGVGILPIGLATLPTFFERHCESIMEHLVPAAADPSIAKYVLVCDDRIPPRGTTPKTRQIWVRIVKVLAPATLPGPETPCWQTSQYLGGYTEAESIRMQCTLDE